MQTESSKEHLVSSPDINIKELSPQNKMRMIWEVFDLGKGTGEERKTRKDNFLKLISKYHEAIIKAKPESRISNITSSVINRKQLHNQIMDILQKMSLSLNVPPTHRKLLEFLASNRDEVERMIETYFLGYDPTKPEEQSTLKKALRGEGLFTSPPLEEKIH